MALSDAGVICGAVHPRATFLHADGSPASPRALTRGAAIAAC
ncbi:MAG: hypothetical protein JWR66_4423 [Modestobacter sp.]|nr:hypothetical protein [Modestobacter sp.]